MSEELSIIISLVSSWLLTGIFGTIIIYFIFHPEKVEKWVAILAKFFSFTSKKVEKIHISKDIQSKLNIYRKEVNKECEDLVPFKANVKFLNPLSFGEDRVEHHEDKVIIIMKDRKNQDENFVKASLFCVKNTLIPNARRYVDPLLMKSADLQFVKNLIAEVDKAKLNYFIDNHLSIQIENDDELAENINILGLLTERGVFTRILLKILREYGLQFFPRPSTPKHFEEPRIFFEKIKEFAHKKSGEDINPTFEGNNIKISIVMIGRSSKVFTETGDINISPYIKWIFSCEDKGINSIFLLARDRTIIAVQQIAYLLDQMPERFEMVDMSVYPVKIRNNFSLKDKDKESKAICMHYLIKNSL